MNSTRNDLQVAFKRNFVKIQHMDSKIENARIIQIEEY